MSLSLEGSITAKLTRAPSLPRLPAQWDSRVQRCRRFVTDAPYGPTLIAERNSENETKPSAFLSNFLMSLSICGWSNSIPMLVSISANSCCARQGQSNAEHNAASLRRTVPRDLISTLSISPLLSRSVLRKHASNSGYISPILLRMSASRFDK